MRRILIDHARGRGRDKRGGAQRRVTLTDWATPSSERNLDFEELLSLHHALERLTEIHERQARIVELRFFAGLTMDEIAHALGVSKRTVESDWTAAREWLRSRLLEEPFG
jgi:RNA polymerase sigma factor (TIGR02999 family)